MLQTLCVTWFVPFGPTRPNIWLRHGLVNGSQRPTHEGGQERGSQHNHSRSTSLAYLSYHQRIFKGKNTVLMSSLHSCPQTMFYLRTTGRENYVTGEMQYPQQKLCPICALDSKASQAKTFHLMTENLVTFSLRYIQTHTKNTVHHLWNDAITICTLVNFFSTQY